MPKYVQPISQAGPKTPPPKCPKCKTLTHRTVDGQGREIFACSCGMVFNSVRM